MAPLSENRDLSGTEPPLDLRPVCKFKFVNFGPEEKTRALFCVSLIVAVRQSARTHFSK